MADTANLIVALKLQDGLSSGLGGVSRQLNTLHGSLGRVGTGIGQVGAGLDRILTRGVLAAGAGLAFAVNQAGDFEASLNTINTIVKLQDEDLRTLGEGIRETFRDSGVPLEDLTAAYYDLLSAGIKVTDAQSVLNQAVQLGIGGLATTAESVDLLTTAINAYGLDAAGAAHASDVFAAAVRDGKVTVAEINASFADVAPLAATVGIKLEEIGAAYAHLTARGVPATEVGVQFNRAIIELLKPGPALVGIMEDLGLANFEASIKSKGLVQTLEDVRVEAEKQGIPFQDLFGRLEAYKFALATTGVNLGDFTEDQRAMGAAAGETAAQFSERQQGLNFQLAKLKANLIDASITIGTELIPVFATLAQDFSEFLGKPGTQEGIKQFADDLAGGIRNLVGELKGADFSGLIQGMQSASDIAARAFDLFNRLPPEIKAMAIGAIVVNKASGGAVGGIARGLVNILGGIGGGLLGRGSSPQNAVWVQSATGGVGGAPGGAGTGGIQGFLRSAAAVTLFTGVAIAVGEIVATNVTRPLNEIAFDFNQVAGASGRFNRPEQAEEFARSLAIQLGIPLADVKTGIVQAVLQEGMTWDEAIAALTAAAKRLEAGLPLLLHPVPPGESGPFVDTHARLREGGSVPKVLPDTAFTGGGGMLPDTAMTALTTTSDQVSRLPAILTDAERAAQQTKFSARLTADRIALTNSLLSQQLGRLGGILAKPTSVTVNTSTTVNIDGRKVSGTITKSQILANPGVM